MPQHESESSRREFLAVGVAALTGALIGCVPEKPAASEGGKSEESARSSSAREIVDDARRVTPQEIFRMIQTAKGESHTLPPAYDQRPADFAAGMTVWRNFSAVVEDTARGGEGKPAAEVLSQLEPIRAATWRDAQRYPFLHVPAEPYSLAAFQSYLCRGLPSALLRFGVLAYPEAIIVSASSDNGRISAMEMTHQFYELGKPSIEEVTIEGRSLSRGVVKLMNRYDGAPPNPGTPVMSHGEASGGMMRIFGHVIVDEAPHRAGYRAYLEDLRQMRDLEGVSRVELYRDIAAAPKTRRESVARQIAFGVALLDSKAALRSYEDYSRQVVQSHEDKHLADWESGRMEGQIAVVRDNSLAALSEANRQTSFNAERGAYIGQITHNEFGLAIALRHYALAEVDPRSLGDTHTEAVVAVIDRLVRVVEASPARFGIAIEQNGIAPRHQILLQLGAIFRRSDELAKLPAVLRE